MGFARRMMRKLRRKRKAGRRRGRGRGRGPQQNRPRNRRQNDADRRRAIAERKRRDLQKAVSELPGKIRPMLDRGTPILWMKARLFAWKLQYRLRKLTVQGKKIVAGNSPDVVVIGTFSIDRGALLRLIHEITLSLIGETPDGKPTTHGQQSTSEHERMKALTSTSSVTTSKGKIIPQEIVNLDNENVSILGKIRMIRERNRTGNRTETVFAGSNAGSSVSIGTGVLASGVDVKRAQDGAITSMRKVGVGRYLAGLTRNKDSRIVQRILEGQAGTQNDPKSGGTLLAQLLGRATRGETLNTKSVPGQVDVEARLQGALTAIMVSEGSRDPSAILDAAMVGKLLENGESPEKVLRALPMGPKGAGSKEAVQLREMFYANEGQTLADLQQQVRDNPSGDTRKKTAREAAVESLRRRVQLVERIAATTAEGQLVDDRDSLERFLRNLIKTLLVTHQT